MDGELKIHHYDLTDHEVTQVRLIHLYDEQGKTLITAPMDPFASVIFFRCFVKQKLRSEPAYKMFLDVMATLGGKLQKIVIDRLEMGNFFATLYFTDRKGNECTTVAEAGDALAMAFCAPCFVYVMESVVDAAKNDPVNRVRWYSPDDEEMLEMVRSYSLEDLRWLPVDEMDQILGLAAEIEDFELAKRVKEAKESIAEIVKKGRTNYIDWDNVEDEEEVLEILNCYGFADLYSIPVDDLKRLLHMADKHEDYDLAMRIKKAMES
jgi:bifunctional DNase/RNase